MQRIGIFSHCIYLTQYLVLCSFSSHTTHTHTRARLQVVFYINLHINNELIAFKRPFSSDKQQATECTNDKHRDQEKRIYHLLLESVFNAYKR